MKELNESIAESGYSREEVYFFEHNKKLMEELREKRALRFDLARRLEETRMSLESHQSDPAAA